ncbi:MAG TPA: hypothetical protein VGG08_02645 [Solirubrobacteraceae bacterium]|jgi:predicted small lipoprotein YifL
MSRRPSRLPLLACVALLAFALAGCGKKSHQPLGMGPARGVAPLSSSGAVSVITSNTARIGGANVAVDAAAVARTVYPGLTAATRPAMVLLVGEQDWPAALAAAAFASAPAHAPLLYSQGNTLPSVTSEALQAMGPKGDVGLGATQLIAIGTKAPTPKSLDTRTLPATDAAATAATIERLLQASAGGSPPKQVIVVPSNAPRALQMPAAGLAAESGAPILYTTGEALPAPTRAVLSQLQHPSIYVLNPRFAGKKSLGELAQLGRVTQISGTAGSEGPAMNAIAVARYTDGNFGWGVKEPGHGLVFLDDQRPLDAPAAALLSSTGDYAPPLLLERPSAVGVSLASYLADIQPAYSASQPQFQAVRGVYNRGWLIGDDRALSTIVQAELDAQLAIAPAQQAIGENSQTEAEGEAETPATQTETNSEQP